MDINLFDQKDDEKSFILFGKHHLSSLYHLRQQQSNKKVPIVVLIDLEWITFLEMKMDHRIHK